jgi:hypothetical protein
MDYSFGKTKIVNKLPKFLQSRVLLHGVVLLFILKIFSVIIFINFPQNIFFADISKISLINLVNQSREAMGLETLTENEKLNQAAYLKAKDMFKNNYFSHQSPQGITPWFWFKLIGYNYKYAGENLAIGFLESEEVYKAWFNSISHRNNILSPDYKEIGTAVLRGDFNGNNTTLVVQLFASPQTIKAGVKKESSKIPPTINKEQEDKAIEINKEVLSQSEKSPLEENTLKFKFLNFVFYNYDEILKYIAYGLLILISAALLLLISVNFDIQHKDLILRTLMLIILLSLVIFLDKETLIQIIPHKITI